MDFTSDSFSLEKKDKKRKEKLQRHDYMVHEDHLSADQEIPTIKISIKYMVRSNYVLMDGAIEDLGHYIFIMPEVLLKATA